jgi:hypothetical protein
MDQFPYSLELESALNLVFPIFDPQVAFGVGKLRELLTRFKSHEM